MSGAHDTEILISGGGFAGLALGIALDGAGYAAAVVEAGDLDAALAPEFDGRVSAIAPDALPMFDALCKRERAPYAVLGQATEEEHLTVSDAHFEDTPIDLPLSVLFGKPPKMTRDVRSIATLPKPLDLSDMDVREAALRVLRLPTVADKTFLVTIGDRTVTGLVARDQMVGPYQVPVADCAVTTADFDGYVGEAMALGERTPVALLEPAASARMAIGEAITNLAAAPVEQLSLVRLSANWMAPAGHPGQDAGLFDMVKAIGMELCPALGIAIPVGKDSMSMRTTWRDGDEAKSVTAPLSLIVTAFAPVFDARKALTPQLRRDRGDTVLVLIDLGMEQNRLGASALAQVYEQLGDEPADLDDPELLKGFFDAIQRLNRERRVLAYHDRSDGGLFATLAEMAFAGGTGLDIRLDGLGGEAIPILFNEELGAVIQVRSDDLEEVLLTFASHGLNGCAHAIGKLRDDDQLRFTLNGKTVLDESRVFLRDIWSDTTHRMQALRDDPECADEEQEARTDPTDPGMSVSVPFAPGEDVAAPFINTGVRPPMAILREQGVNGHVEMAAAFDRAEQGGRGVQVVGGGEPVEQESGVRPHHVRDLRQLAEHPMLMDEAADNAQAGSGGHRQLDHKGQRRVPVARTPDAGLGSFGDRLPQRVVLQPPGVRVHVRSFRG